MTDVGDKANNHLIISGDGTNYQSLDDPDVDAIFLAFGSKDSYIQIISSVIVCPITLINVGYLLISKHLHGAIAYVCKLRSKCTCMPVSIRMRRMHAS